MGCESWAFSSQLMPTGNPVQHGNYYRTSQEKSGENRKRRQCECTTIFISTINSKLSVIFLDLQFPEALREGHGCDCGWRQSHLRQDGMRCGIQLLKMSPNPGESKTQHRQCIPLAWIQTQHTLTTPGIHDEVNIKTGQHVLLLVDSEIFA